MRLLSFILLSLCAISLFAQEGYEIKVKIDGFKGDRIFLAYHYGNTQYVRDTVYRSTDDFFIFNRENEVLEPGNYMVIMPPNNQFFDLLITQEEQYFTVNTSMANPFEDALFEGKAEENRLFYRYLNFLNKQRVKSAEVDSDQSVTQGKEALKKAIDEEVKTYQSRLFKEYPASLTAAFIKASSPIDYTDYKGTTDEEGLHFTKEHYFDKLDINDDRLLRTPFLVQKIDYFVEKLQYQTPQYIIPAIDKVLSMMDPKGENFKFFTVHFLNKYAKSKIVGMDEVYVHMAKKYYGSGLASWVEPDQLEKILNNANKIEPILIGRIAPELALKTRDGLATKLHAINSEYTVLYFWRPDCENCKKTAPILQEFYENYKDNGVKIAAICTKDKPEVDGCWAYVDENNYNDWVHLADPDRNSGMLSIYNIRATPTIYLLNRDKKIISKGISASQLAEVLDFHLNK